MPARRRRSALLSVETIERRALLSGVASVAELAITRAALRAESAAGNIGGASGGASSGGSAGGELPATPPSQSPLFGSGTPTPRELARERFTARFAGPYYRGPGRFTDQQGILYLRGVGSSNDFLHGDLNLAVATQKDPTLPLVGEAVMQDKNINNSAVLGMVLRADRSTLDRYGRPTVLTFSEDPSIYGGPFFVNQSQGIVKIHYRGNIALAVFTGRLYTSGLTNPLRNADLISGRPI